MQFLMFLVWVYELMIFRCKTQIPSILIHWPTRGYRLFFLLQLRLQFIFPRSKKKDDETSLDSIPTFIHIYIVIIIIYHHCDVAKRRAHSLSVCLCCAVCVYYCARHPIEDTLIISKMEYTSFILLQMPPNLNENV